MLNFVQQPVVIKKYSPVLFNLKLLSVFFQNISALYQIKAVDL